MVASIGMSFLALLRLTPNLFSYYFGASNQMSKSRIMCSELRLNPVQ